MMATQLASLLLLLLACVPQPSFQEQVGPAGETSNNSCACKTGELLELMKQIQTSQLNIQGEVNLLREQLLTKLSTEDVVRQQNQEFVRKEIAGLKADLVRQLASQSAQNQKSIQTLAASIKSGAQQKCPRDYTEYGDSCYKIVKSSSSWEDALQRCHEDGGHLVSIETKEEQTFIENMIKHTINNFGVFTKDNINFWIGGHDKKTERTHIWESTGKKFTFVNWDKGQPDNSGNEDCTEMWKGFKWNDDNCGARKSYICEI